MAAQPVSHVGYSFTIYDPKGIIIEDYNVRQDSYVYKGNLQTIIRIKYISNPKAVHIGSKIDFSGIEDNYTNAYSFEIENVTTKEKMKIIFDNIKKSKRDFLDVEIYFKEGEYYIDVEKYFKEKLSRLPVMIK